MHSSWLQHRLCKVLPLILFIGGLFFISSGPQFVPECRSEELPNLLGAKDYCSDSLLEDELLLLINQQRMRQGLQALILDNALTQIAREHSRDMAQQGFISHTQPSGDIKTRMEKAGYLYEVVRENLASAQTISKAHTALIKSSPHKDNILAGDVTRIGIGIAQYQRTCGSQLYITEVFADPREEYQPEMVQTMLTNRVNELRHKGVGALESNRVLQEIASRSIQSITIPYKKEDLRSLAASSVSELQEHDRAAVSRIEVDVQLVHNPRNLRIPVLEREGQARMYGSAVRKITDSRNQTSFLVLTLIGITR
jgi:hypothetical protein